MLFVGKEPQSMHWGLVLGVEGNPGKVLRVEEPTYSGLRSFSKTPLDI